MGFLPVSANIYFNDFSSDLETFEVKRGAEVIGTFSGLPNYEDGQNYVHFKYEDNIRIGDKLTSEARAFVVKSIEVDKYNGKPELIRAYQ